MNHIDALFDLFNETILDRGEDYYVEGHVKKVQYSDNGNEKDLMPYFAEELRDFFFKNVREEMWRANCREHYRTAIRHLKEIEKYPDSAETIRQIADEWRTQHKRRSSMLDELKKAGL